MTHLFGLVYDLLSPRYFYLNPEGPEGLELTLQLTAMILVLWS
jgi:hypothetical protein